MKGHRGVCWKRNRKWDLRPAFSFFPTSTRTFRPLLALTSESLSIASHDSFEFLMEENSRSWLYPIVGCGRPLGASYGMGHFSRRNLFWRCQPLGVLSRFLAPISRSGDCFWPTWTKNLLGGSWLYIYEGHMGSRRSYGLETNVWR